MIEISFYGDMIGKVPPGHKVGDSIDASKVDIDPGYNVFSLYTNVNGRETMMPISSPYLTCELRVRPTLRALWGMWRTGFRFTLKTSGPKLKVNTGEEDYE